MAEIVRLGWRKGELPPTGAIVEVWYSTSIILAVFDGSCWKTTEGDRLVGVSHWRFRQ